MKQNATSTLREFTESRGIAHDPDDIRCLEHLNLLVVTASVSTAFGGAIVETLDLPCEETLCLMLRCFLVVRIYGGVPCPPSSMGCLDSFSRPPALPSQSILARTSCHGSYDARPYRGL